jgi:hypothetical protein
MNVMPRETRPKDVQRLVDWSDPRMTAEHVNACKQILVILAPFRAFHERVFNQGIQCSPVSHFRCAGHIAASCTKDEPLLPLGMKDRLGQRFDFQNRRQST